MAGRGCSGRVEMTSARNPGHGEGGIGRAKAWTSSDEVREMLWTKEGARGDANLVGHCAGAANWRGRALARANWPKQYRNKGNQAWERVPYLGTVLGKASRGSGWLGRPTRRAWISGGLWRQRQSARERVGVGEMRQERERVGTGSDQKGQGA